MNLGSPEKPHLRVAVALVRRGSRYLVARRHDHAHLGGLWEFPGGKCEPGEGEAHAALRELREECGVEAIEERELPAFEVDYGDRHVRLTPIICRWTAGQGEPLHSQECRWVSLAEMRRLDMPEVNAAIIRELQTFA
jgi:8-oxo-dGTP diphosphatase